VLVLQSDVLLPNWLMVVFRAMALW